MTVELHYKLNSKLMPVICTVTSVWLDSSLSVPSWQCYQLVLYKSGKCVLLLKQTLFIVINRESGHLVAKWKNWLAVHLTKYQLAVKSDGNYNRLSF